MTQALANRPSVVAGLVRALCTCCAEPQELTAHQDLDAAHRVCPQSLVTYLDRGDGVFETEGRRLTTRPTGRAAGQIEAVGTPQALSEEPDLLSDRPARTGAKSRIVLEKATFAGER